MKSRSARPRVSVPVLSITSTEARAIASSTLPPFSSTPRRAALLLGKGGLVHATHQQLADELGSVREMVSRLLKGFAEQGLVKLGREQVEVLDAAGLRKVASVT